MERNQMTRVVGATRWPGNKGVKAPQEPCPQGPEDKDQDGVSHPRACQSPGLGPGRAPELKPEGEASDRWTPRPGPLGIRQAGRRERLPQGPVGAWQGP
ncbi:hypothetical protein NDU88_006090 [Pleurodeles waltl]|uniref:Uncharacterized protein n=1 Tax=Pleurodeles waltl TaxID=8319 RepID=A0AAV7LQY5_PLEWA|nr:hypothetical protein NDU88_006090 [Pleurodeles waltl]